MNNNFPIGEFGSRLLPWLLGLALSVATHGASVHSVPQEYFSNGSGGEWNDRISTVFAPKVANDGRVAFVAVKPGYKATASIIDTLTPRGVYMVDVDNPAATPQVILAPEIPPFDFPVTSFNFVADWNTNEFWGVTVDTTSSNGMTMKRMRYYSPATGETKNDIPNTSSSYDSYTRLHLTNIGRRLLCTGDVQNIHDTLRLHFMWMSGAHYTVEPSLVLERPTRYWSCDRLIDAYAPKANALYYLATISTSSPILELRRHSFDTNTSESIAELGERRNLGVYEGSYSSNKVPVSCSADGKVVACVYANSQDVNTVQIAVYRQGADGIFYSTVITRNGQPLYNCGWPAVSADGNRVLFTGSESADGPKAAWLWEVPQKRLTKVSGAFATDVEGTAISDNGRYGAFVAAPTADAKPQVHRVSLDDSLYGGEGITLFPGQSNVPLGVVCYSDPEQQLTLTIPNDFPGSIVDCYGTRIFSNQPVPVARLPWRISVDEGVSDNTWEMPVAFADAPEISSVIRVTVSSSREVARGKNALFSDLGFSNSGDRLVFLTDVALTPGRDTNKAADVYCYHRDGDFVRMISAAGKSTSDNSPVISGDGQVIYWRNNDGNLYSSRNPGKVLSDYVYGVTNSIGKCGIATSYDGQKLLLPNDEALVRSSDGGVTIDDYFGAGPERRPMLSYCGRVAWFLRGIEDEEIMGKYHVRLVVDSGRRVNGEGENGPEPREMTFGGVGVDDLCGITHDGTKALVRLVDGTYKLVGIDGTTQSLFMQSGVQSAFLSANGRYVFYRYKVNNSAERLLRRKVSDTYGIQDMELPTPDDANPGNFAVSGNGEMVAYVLRGNDGVNRLMLYRYPDWQNNRPRRTITAASTTQDATNPVTFDLSNGVVISDDDGDCIGFTLMPTYGKGTTQLQLPDQNSSKYLLKYTPKAKYAGRVYLQVEVFDGTSRDIWGYTVNVQNVNDAPEWGEVPATVTATVGGITTFTASATDPDLDNDPPYNTEKLTWSLVGGAPEWVSINANTGEVTLAPNWFQKGRSVELTLRVSDLAGVSPADKVVRIEVESLPPQRFSLAELMDGNGNTSGNGAPSGAALAGEAGWRQAVLGIWSDLKNGWQPLSLPADAAADEIKALLGSNELLLYDAEKRTYRHTAAGEVIPGGVGFWAKVQLPEEGVANTAAITLTPVNDEPATPGAEGRFFGGPVVGQQPLDDTAIIRGIQGEAWCKGAPWKMGRAVFVDMP